MKLHGHKYSNVFLLFLTGNISLGHEVQVQCNVNVFSVFFLVFFGIRQNKYDYMEKRAAFCLKLFECLSFVCFMLSNAIGNCQEKTYAACISIAKFYMVLLLLLLLFLKSQRSF